MTVVALFSASRALSLTGAIFDTPTLIATIPSGDYGISPYIILTYTQKSILSGASIVRGYQTRIVLNTGGPIFSGTTALKDLGIYDAANGVIDSVDSILVNTGSAIGVPSTSLGYNLNDGATVSVVNQGSGSLCQSVGVICVAVISSDDTTQLSSNFYGGSLNPPNASGGVLSGTLPNPSITPFFGGTPFQVFASSFWCTTPRSPVPVSPIQNVITAQSSFAGVSGTAISSIDFYDSSSYPIPFEIDNFPLDIHTVSNSVQIDYMTTGVLFVPGSPQPNYVAMIG